MATSAAQKALSREPASLVLTDAKDIYARIWFARLFHDPLPFRSTVARESISDVLSISIKVDVFSYYVHIDYTLCGVIKNCTLQFRRIICFNKRRLGNL